MKKVMNVLAYGCILVGYIWLIIFHFRFVHLYHGIFLLYFLHYYKNPFVSISFIHIFP